MHKDIKKTINNKVFVENIVYYTYSVGIGGEKNGTKIIWLY